eukprot:6822264-Alexandrium_andersonii.AAC.1
MEQGWCYGERSWAPELSPEEKRMPRSGLGDAADGFIYQRAPGKLLFHPIPQLWVGGLTGS